MGTMQLAPPIARGFLYRLQVRATGDYPAFPAGCALKGELRAAPGAPALLGTLTTADGSLVRIDDDVVELRIAGSVTRDIPGDRVALDIVRVDLSPDEWLGIQFTLPVVKPVTLPGSDA